MSTKSSSLFLRTSLGLGLALALAACGQSSDERRSSDRDDEVATASDTINASPSSQGIEQSARQLFGGASPQDIRESEIKGLMQVKVNGNVFYASPDGRYFMQGDMIEVATMTSMTDAARTDGREDLIADIDPEELGAITYKADDEKFEVYVFTDISCPYCTRFHEDMAKHNENGVTVHYFAWPRSGPDSDVADSMSNAWCADDQKKVLDDLFENKDIPNAQCDSPVADHFELGRTLMVSGTPAVFSPDGRQHGGYMEPADLMRSLEEGQR